MSKKILKFVLLAATARAARFEAVEPHMGTLVHITIYAPDASAIPFAFARIAELDEKLSDYNPGSELNQLCRTAHDHPVHVSADLYRVLDAAQNLSRETGGAFDITIGPITHLWRKGLLPDPASLSRVGYRNLVLNRRDRTAYLKLPDMQLDLGAIAKGYAADEALTTLRNHHVTRALVAVSGDIAASGPPPNKKGWTIAIEATGEKIRLSNAAISTSGDTEQSRDIGGVRYAHIIDPKTGLGLTTHLTVTVLARRGLTADPVATAVTILGEARGRALLEKKVKIITAPVDSAVPRSTIVQRSNSQ